jgi:hypothetical protein
MVRGFSIHAVADDLTKNNPLFQNTSINTIISDWTRRKTWLYLIIRPDDATILDETIGSIREVAAAAWIEHGRAKSSNEKVGALRTVLEANGRLIDIMQGIGAITRAPIAITTVGPSDEEVWGKLTDEEKRQLIAMAEVVAAARRTKQP